MLRWLRAFEEGCPDPTSIALWPNAISESKQQLLEPLLAALF